MSELWRWTRPKARKEAKCDGCYRTIRVGEKYNKCEGLHDLSMGAWRECEHCWRLVSLYAIGDPYEDERPGADGIGQWEPQFEDVPPTCLASSRVLAETLDARRRVPLPGPGARLVIGGPLPVMWDAVPVSWSEWRVDWSSLDFHLPIEALACERCGVLDKVAACSARHPDAGRLHAFRCQHCGLDSVHVLETGETWVLGPEDYGPDGSHEADVLF